MSFINALKPQKIIKQPNEGELDFWRRLLFERIIYFLFLTTSVLIIPSAWGGFALNIPFVGIFDIAVYLTIVLFYVNRLIPNNIRVLIIEIIYVIGIGILATIGPHGAGFIWLFAYSAITTILFGKKGAFRSQLLVIIGVLLCLLELKFKWFPELKIHDFDIISYSLTSINLIGLIYVTNLSFGSIIKRLEKVFLSQKEITQKFKSKSIELQKSNEDLDNLVYSISHDIRSPLANIKGLAQMGKEDIKNEDALNYFLKIDQSADKLQHFTEQITNYFKVENGVLKPENIMLKQFLDDLFYVNYSSLLKKDDQFLNNIQEDIQLNIDSTRFTLVIMNLISNAIKYKSETRPLTIVCYANRIQDEIEVVLEDNGSGIANDQLPNIFDMFTRASKRSSGTGLGLYILSQCMSSLKGQVKVER